MTGRPVTFTRHAETMLAERNIERAWVERVIGKPDFVEPDANLENVVRAFRAIAERGGRILRVVYSVRGNQIVVITAFFDRAKRR
jgi:uncharacterized DUF497 family protein